MPEAGIPKKFFCPGLLRSVEVFFGVLMFTPGVCPFVL